MRSFYCVFVLLFSSLAFSFRFDPRSISRPFKSSLFKLADSSKYEYEVVLLDKRNIENAAAITGGVVGFMICGPVWGVVLAAVSNYVVKKDDDSGEVLRGFGKTVIESYNFLNKIDAKYHLTGKVSSAISNMVSNVTSNSEVLDNVKKTCSNTIIKVEEIYKEYDLTTKSKQAIYAAGQLSDAAIHNAVELNRKYVIATGKRAVSILNEKLREANGSKIPK